MRQIGFSYELRDLVVEQPVEMMAHGYIKHTESNPIPGLVTTRIFDDLASDGSWKINWLQVRTLPSFLQPFFGKEIRGIEKASFDSKTGLLSVKIELMGDLLTNFGFGDFESCCEYKRLDSGRSIVSAVASTQFKPFYVMPAEGFLIGLIDSELKAGVRSAEQKAREHALEQSVNVKSKKRRDLHRKLMTLQSQMLSAKRGSEERAILGQRADAIEEEALQLYILRDKELKEIEEINVEMEEERTVRSTSFDVVLRGYPSKDWSMSDSDLWFSKHPDADLGSPSSVFRTDLRQFQSFLI